MAYPTAYRDNLGTAKASAIPNPAQFVSIRYGRNTNSFPVNASPTTTPNNWGDAQNRFNSINVNHNWVLAGAKLNEVVFQYSNFNDLITDRTKVYNQSFPNGVATGGSLLAPQSTEQVKYQIRDDFSWLMAGHGGLGHSFKAGVNFINEPRLFIDGASGKGIISYSMLSSSLTSPVFSVTQIGGEASANIPTKQYGFYVQDDWRVGEQLTVNTGVQYDPLPVSTSTSRRTRTLSSSRCPGWIAERDRGPRKLRPRSAVRPEQHSAAHWRHSLI